MGRECLFLLLFAGWLHVSVGLSVLCVCFVQLDVCCVITAAL